MVVRFHRGLLDGPKEDLREHLLEFNWVQREGVFSSDVSNERSEDVDDSMQDSAMSWVQKGPVKRLLFSMP